MLHPPLNLDCFPCITSAENPDAIIASYLSGKHPVFLHAPAPLRLPVPTIPSQCMSGDFITVARRPVFIAHRRPGNTISPCLPVKPWVAACDPEKKRRPKTPQHPHWCIKGEGMMRQRNVEVCSCVKIYPPTQGSTRPLTRRRSHALVCL